MTLTITLELQNEAKTDQLGRQLAHALPAGAVVYLHGDLGAGKTTLVRGVLRGLQYEGKVKSPTYTLVEPYPWGAYSLYHFDLYRLKVPVELTQLGLADYLDEHSTCWFEWPEKGEGVLPPPDLVCTLSYQGEGREAELSAKSEKGERWLKALTLLGVGKPAR